MSHIRRSLAATPLPGVVVGAVAGGAFSALALADAGARPLHLAVVKLQITSVTGRSDLCSLAQSTAVGDGTSYLSTGPGSFQAALTMTPHPVGPATSSASPPC
jgi:hypothetical protein